MRALHKHSGHCGLGSTQPRSHLRSNQLSSRSTCSGISPALQHYRSSISSSSNSSSSSTCSLRSSQCSSSSSSLSSSGSIHQPQAAACSSSSSSTGSRPSQRQRRAVTAAASAADGPGSSSSSSSQPVSSSAVILEQDDVVSPFSEDDLLGMTEAESAIDQDALADAWRENFDNDLDGLYNYVDRAHGELQEKVEELHSIPRHLWNKVGVLDELSKFPAGLVADMVGLGTWRLNGMVDEVFSFLMGRIEHSFRELLDTDLALYPSEKWKDKGWDFIDSLDPSREWGGFSYMDMPDPAKGQEGYPRLMIENRIYSSRVFRKLHLELAHRQDGLQVMHMVLFPRYDFDIPILALDLVAAGGSVTLAIIDVCPVTPRLNLPQHYTETMMELQQNFLPDSLLSSENRSIPAWGSAIFSPLCLCITPKTPEELAGFLKYAVALTRAHLMYSRLLEPLRPTSKPSAKRLQELLACHKRFCEQQLANKKTARVLDAAFDPAFSQQYMEQLMFDYSPTEDVPWFDGGLAKLFDYFEKNPEIWQDAGLFMKTKLELDGAKASEYLRRFLAGDPSIKLPRLSFAMQHMYNTDEDFRGSVNRYVSNVPPEELPSTADMGEFLAVRFMELMESGRQQKQQQQGAAAPAAAAKAAAAAALTPAPEAGQQQQQDKKDG